MSTIIQRIFCNHQYKQINAITLVCEKCGKVKRIKCCHKWEGLKITPIYKYSFGCRLPYGYYTTYVCSNCGKLKIIKTKYLG